MTDFSFHGVLKALRDPGAPVDPRYWITPPPQTPKPDNREREILGRMQTR